MKPIRITLELVYQTLEEKNTHVCAGCVLHEEGKECRKDPFGLCGNPENMYKVYKQIKQTETK